MTIPGGYTAGDVLTAADMNLLPAGLLDYAEKTADQGPITTVVDVSGLSVSWTAVAGRAYRVHAWGFVSVGGTGDLPNILMTDSSNTQFQGWSAILTSATYPTPWSMTSVLTSAVGASTFKIRAALAAGAGSIAIVASATIPAGITVEDIGPS